MYEVHPAIHLSSKRDILFPSQSVKLPACLAGDNFLETSDSNLLDFRERTYGDRQIDLPSVDLLRIDGDAILCGGRNFILRVANILLKEQYPPIDVIPSPTAVEELLREKKQKHHIKKEVVLASRWGIMTWGHWIGEIYPRIVIAERFFPGRFTYAVPQDIFNGNAKRNVWNSILESISALGVKRDRLLQIFYHIDYTFDNLYVITDVFHTNRFHPDAIHCMREMLDIERREQVDRMGERKIAVLRTESSSRNIENLDEVADRLKKVDFEFVEVGRLPFREQISLFRSASTVAGVLASGLTGLFFSPTHVKVLSFAPKGYVNEFFPPIIQSLSGKIWDLRGDITRRDPRSEIFSDFRVPLNSVETAIQSFCS